MKPNRLSGYVPIRNGITNDYCFELAIRSLAPICDEIVVCDSESTDGTLQRLAELASEIPALRIISRPWPNLATYETVKDKTPGAAGDAMMLPKWLNFIRERCRYEMQITLDADEIVHPDSYPAIREAVQQGGARWFRRLNFWRDAHHLVPDGWVCGSAVARLGPTALWMPSDECHPEGEPELRKIAQHDDRLVIMHYGFLRHDDAFYRKSKVCQPAICNDYDARLEEAERTGRKWWELSNFPAPLVPFEGEHPLIARAWLRERGRL